MLTFFYCLYLKIRCIKKSVTSITIQITMTNVKWLWNWFASQWRIQDFPEEGAPTPRGGANLWFCQFSPKTAWKRRHFCCRGGGGGRASPAPPLDPPLQLLHVSNLFPLEVVRKCQRCQLCVLQENPIDMHSIVGQKSPFIVFIFLLFGVPVNESPDETLSWESQYYIL